MPKVEIPPRYRGPTRGTSVFEVDAQTIRGCIEAIEALHPGFSELILDSDGNIRRFVSLFLNGDLIDRKSADTSVSAEDEIRILASAAGG